MLVKRITVGSILNPHNLVQTVEVPAHVTILGTAAIAAYVGFSIGGPVGAAVGAILGTVVGTVVAFMASGRVKKIRVILKKTGEVCLEMRT